MPVAHSNSFNTLDVFNAGTTSAEFHRLAVLDAAGVTELRRLPFSIRVLLENALRHEDGRLTRSEHIEALARWHTGTAGSMEIPYMPSRVLLQDFTGVPAVVDLAAMRDAVAAMGGDPDRINPLVPADLVIDHSVQVDRFGSRDSLRQNIDLEYDRNRERYVLLRWAQRAFRNFRVIPPGTGICHQVNLEYLAQVVHFREESGRLMAFPDTCVGTDSHTTMVNGLGVMGWGVGGIEAEAVMLGQPYYMLIPEVIGFRLTGVLPEGATATDLVLTVTQILRKRGVVDKFVEFFGPGLDHLTLPDRTVIANMAPEYGATMGFFPVDAGTLDYLRMTGRDEEQIRKVEGYCRAQGLFRTSATPEPAYTDILELDLGTVEPSLAGPKRPQDRLALGTVKAAFEKSLTAPVAERGYALASEEAGRRIETELHGSRFELGHGAVVIAAITSCTNTSNPAVMIAAGLVARKACARGLDVKPWVKTSLAPGSRVVTDYLVKSNLLDDLEALRFHVVGYGCTTCIGNSGPLPEAIETAIRQGDLVAASVLSGNRNFEGRIHPATRANYLASPPLVVAYALAGRVDIDFRTEPIGTGADGRSVFLADIWPTQKEIMDQVGAVVTPEMFRRRYAEVTDGDETWRSMDVPSGERFLWDPASRYIRKPNFFERMTPEAIPIAPVMGARVLALLGDSVTTDHISPAGNIAADSPAGRYLQGYGIPEGEFNSYGSRRGNHEVMVRGTFANIRLKNLLLPGTEGGMTRHHPTGAAMAIYDAAVAYGNSNTPLIVLAGREYGTGSSRDWAAKGTFLLGIRAVIAQSYERIHRGNLIGMGVLPLQFLEGESWPNLGLTGQETYSIPGLNDSIAPGQTLHVIVEAPDGGRREFSAVARLNSAVEVEYYRHGGILQAVLRQMFRR
jgi:aconitate hydratase